MAVFDAETTRVFIKGLPPSFTSEQLASHFQKQYRVTDAHVIPQRRIGFVGFSDHASAQNAVNHFNRSFIRMSKIAVELARAVEVKRDASGQAVPVSKKNTSYPDRNHAESRAELIRLDDSASKKRKRDGRDDGEKERSNDKDADPEVTTKVQSDGQEIADQMNVGEDTVEAEVVPVRSDSDWLRGKTTRLLDLVEPEETATSEHSVDGVLHPDPSNLENTLTADREPDSGEDKAQAALVVFNGRLFIRNLAFDVTDADLENRFSQFGKIQEAHVVKDAKKSTSKGIAFVQFSEPEAAESAQSSLDGVSFHGRLLHILPASDKRDQGLTDYDISKMPLKKQKAVKRKMDAGTATFSWNSLYMNPDAVISSIADRLGVSKSDILDPTSADAAVKQAHAETQLIAETKGFLRNNGVNVDAFQTKVRDDRTILLKNFPFGTSEAELKALLEPFGHIARFIFPPAGTMAISQYTEPYSASQALKQLAYKNIKGSVLYLEKAPRGLLDGKVAKPVANAVVENELHRSLSANEEHNSVENTTLFVRNLHFSTTSSRLTEVFGSLPGFMSARVKTRLDPKRPSEILSMGFGFVEFKNKASASTALSALNGHRLDGHELIVQISNKVSDLAEERRREDNDKKMDANSTKIIIKNLPFQASKKDVRSLFSPYGQLKTVRVPKKFDSSSRGFGFAEFVTAKEAQNAMDALSDTHLLGRRLVLEFTQEEEIDPEEQILGMERKMEQQSNRMQLSKLTGNTRRKFVVGTEDDQN